MDLFFKTVQSYKGLSKEAIYARVYLSRVNNLLIPEIPLEELGKIRIDEKKDCLLFRANRGADRIVERFSLEHRGVIENYLKKYKRVDIV